MMKKRRHEAVAICDCCGEEIYEGETILNLDGDAYICEDCLNDMSARELMELMNMETEEAEDYAYEAYVEREIDESR